jgi:phosphoserine phosphatase
MPPTGPQCLLLVADPALAPLEPALVETLGRRHGGTVRGLADSAAVELALDPCPPRETLAEALAGRALDWALVPAAGRRKRLLVSDMDSTIIDIECIDELADFVGIKAEVAAITRRAMNGELDFAAALTERVALLEGVEEKAIAEICRERLRLNPGARTLVSTMRAAGALTILVSGGFTLFTAFVARLAGFERHHGNRLEIRDGRLTGRVLPPILGALAKLETLDEAAAGLGLDREAALALGDGANDRPMLEAAGLAVAWRPHPVLAAAADLVLAHADLAAALHLQGYAAAELTRA